MQKTNVPQWIQAIRQYHPQDETEKTEQEMILQLAEKEGERLLTRECPFYHLTASSMIFTPDRSRVLMAWHNIYRSFAWTGGHCDGDGDFEEVARREAEEETGVQGLSLLGDGMASMEIIPVWTHVKRGKVVGSHLHLNISYLFEAGEEQKLRIAPEENQKVAWLPAGELSKYCTEKEMIPIYNKLISRANDC